MMSTLLRLNLEKFLKNLFFFNNRFLSGKDNNTLLDSPAGVCVKYNDFVNFVRGMKNAPTSAPCKYVLNILLVSDYDIETITYIFVHEI